MTASRYLAVGVILTAASLAQTPNKKINSAAASAATNGEVRMSRVI